jgi:hypothetical protein
MQDIRPYIASFIPFKRFWQVLLLGVTDDDSIKMKMVSFSASPFISSAHSNNDLEQTLLSITEVLETSRTNKNG